MGIESTDDVIQDAIYLVSYHNMIMKVEKDYTET